GWSLVRNFTFPDQDPALQADRSKTRTSPRRRLPLLITSSVGIAVILCVSLTQGQIAHWKNTETLFRHALLVTQGNYLAHCDLGAALEKQNRLAEAADELRQALKH